MFCKLPNTTLKDFLRRTVAVFRYFWSSRHRVAANFKINRQNISIKSETLKRAILSYVFFIFQVLSCIADMTQAQWYYLNCMSFMYVNCEELTVWQIVYNCWFTIFWDFFFGIFPPLYRLRRRPIRVIAPLWRKEACLISILLLHKYYTITHAAKETSRQTNLCMFN